MKRAKEAASTDGEGIINKRVAQGPQSHACWPGEYQRHESLPVRALWAASWLRSASRNSGAAESCLSSERTTPCRSRWGSPSSVRSARPTRNPQEAG